MTQHNKLMNLAKYSSKGHSTSILWFLLFHRLILGDGTKIYFPEYTCCDVQKFIFWNILVVINHFAFNSQTAIEWWWQEILASLEIPVFLRSNFIIFTYWETYSLCVNCSLCVLSSTSLDVKVSCLKSSHLSQSIQSLKPFLHHLMFLFSCKLNFKI